MVSSLAAQLAKGASINTQFLVDRTKRKYAESFLFTGKEAEQYDLESIHALAVNGFAQLLALEPSFSQFQELISESSRNLDRTLLGNQENAELNGKLGLALLQLGPFLLETPTAKFLEWLVRRYRIHEFNVDDILRLFLPYHESSHFVKMLSILHIKESSNWVFLNSVKDTVRPLHRTTLVTHMLKNMDVTRFVVSLPTTVIEASCGHRTIYAFNTGTMLEYLARVDKIDEPLLALLLPALLEPLNSKNDRDCILGNYILLAALSQKCKLTSKALTTVVDVMLGCATVLDTQQAITALIAVCNPQEQLESFPKTIVSDTAHLNNLTTVLPEVFRWAGVEKFVVPLLPGLIKKADKSLYIGILDSIVNNNHTPRSIISSLMLLLIQEVASHQDSVPKVVGNLLVTLNQRHLKVYEQVVKGSLDAVADLNERRALEDRLSSVLYGSSSGLITSMHGTNDADASLRVAAIQKILDALDISEGSSPDTDAVADSLLARVTETELSVLEALYSDSAKLLSLLADRRVQYLERVQTSMFAGNEVSRRVVRAHLTFLAKHFCVTYLDEVSDVFEKICFPLLLLTKSKLKTSSLIWELLNGSPLGDYEVIKGCSQLVNDGEDDHAIKNWKIAETIARNILNSNEYPKHLDLLLSQLQRSQSEDRVFALLILGALVSQLNGQHQVDASLSVLKSIQDRVGFYPISIRNSSVAQFTSSDNLCKSVFSHTHSGNTEACLAYYLLSLIAAIPAPVGAKVDWVGTQAHQAEGQVIGLRYAEAIRRCYIIAVGLPPALGLVARTITGAIFRNLAGNTACLLAGIWSDPSQPFTIQVAAFKHCLAFIVSRTDGTEFKEDFQIILPSLLLALMLPNQATREAAMDCVAVLATSDPAVKSLPIYAFDSLYGASSDQLQYLSWEEVCRFVKAIAERRTFFTTDPEYLATFHTQFLQSARSESSKEASFKSHVVCFLLSHALCWHDNNRRTSILRLLGGVSHSAKLSTISPLVRTIGEENLPETLIQHLLACFDRSVGSLLNDKDNHFWTLYIGLTMRSLEEPVQLAYSPLLQVFETGLRQTLSFDRRLELCLLVCQYAASDTHKTNNTAVQSWLRGLVEDPPIVLKILGVFHTQAEAQAEPTQKRARVASDETSEAISPAALSLFLDAANSTALPGTVELISQLIEALRRASLLKSISAASVSQLQQLILTSLENAVKHVTDAVAFTKSVLRIDAITDLIRTARNPRILHQSLLLIASMSQLAPDSVLQNIMPIFTIMGSDILNRDDANSFRVVQQTIDAAVPVLVRSLQAQHAHSKLELYQGARPFLQVFADASNHIPKHRRSLFFIHLSRAFQAEEFIAPLLLLLLEKHVPRSGKTKKTDTGSVVPVCLSVIRDASASAQATITKDLLDECHRLLSPTEQSFLEPLSDKESAGASQTTPKERQVIVILQLIQQALPTISLTVHQPSPIETETETVIVPKVADSLGEVLELLLALLPKARTQGAPPSSEVSTRISDTIRTCVKGMRVDEFVYSVLGMLGSENNMIQEDAFEIVHERLPHIGSSWRYTLSDDFMEIAAFCKLCLRRHTSASRLLPALGALQTLVDTAITDELNPLTDLADLILDVFPKWINEDAVMESGLALLESIITMLGPRVIPHFTALSTFSVSCTETQLQLSSHSVKDKDEPKAKTRARSRAARVLIALLSKLSNFWTTKGLSDVVGLCIRYDRSRSVEVDTIGRAIVKHIPAEMGLPTMIYTWEHLLETEESETPRHRAFYVLLKKILHNATRPQSLENLKPLSRLFERAFELHAASVLEDESADIDRSDELDKAFLELICKLNESSFKPLFRRLSDWASGEDVDLSSNGKLQSARWLTFCDTVKELIGYFKALLNPFILIILDRIMDRLEAYGKKVKQVGYKSLPFPAAWVVTLQVLEQSFTTDDGTLWRGDKIRQMIPHLAAQVPSASSSSANIETLQQCLNALGGICNSDSDDDLLKRLQLAILMHTRSEECAIKLCALGCARSLWEDSNAGERLVGFANDTATFIAECAEDDHDEVAKSARSLRRAVEAVSGSLEAVLS